MCPTGGCYRLQAVAGPVEANALRASLGVRPLPWSLAGSLRGLLGVSGPLDAPVYSGSAAAVRPTPELLAGVEACPALSALLADRSAVAAYDRVPASAAGAVFSLDSGTGILTLHSGQAVPAGGGLLQAAGRMWVAPEAETDPRAVAMEAAGSGLDAAALAAAYLGGASDVRLQQRDCNSIGACCCVVAACTRASPPALARPNCSCCSSPPPPPHLSPPPPTHTLPHLSPLPPLLTFVSLLLFCRPLLLSGERRPAPRLCWWEQVL